MRETPCAVYVLWYFAFIFVLSREQAQRSDAYNIVSVLLLYFRTGLLFSSTKQGGGDNPHPFPQGNDCFRYFKSMVSFSSVPVNL